MRQLLLITCFFSKILLVKIDQIYGQRNWIFFGRSRKEQTSRQDQLDRCGRSRHGDERPSPDQHNQLHRRVPIRSSTIGDFIRVQHLSER